MQRGGGEHGGAVVSDPLEHRGQPELDGLGHMVGFQPGDDVPVPLGGPPGPGQGQQRSGEASVASRR